jgi:hypothetical protein
MTILKRHRNWDEAYADLEELGATVCGPHLERNRIENLIANLPPLTSAGTRTLLNTEVGQSIARISAAFLIPILGEKLYPVRAILFDKSPEVNWNLGFHQDTKIAVQAKHELPGYTHWSVKEGIHHCRPPVEFLENMVALRIVLDDNDESNGPLIIAPGTHKQGFISADQINEIVQKNGQLAALAQAGDFVLMKPLTLHASGKSTSPNHRRVIHIEYAGTPLPEQLT